jgi:hypothetical protein
MPKIYQTKRAAAQKLKAAFSKTKEIKEPEKPVKIIDSTGKIKRIL